MDTSVRYVSTDAINDGFSAGENELRMLVSTIFSHFTSVTGYISRIPKSEYFILTSWCLLFHVLSFRSITLSAIFSSQ